MKTAYVVLFLVVSCTLSAQTIQKGTVRPREVPRPEDMTAQKQAVPLGVHLYVDKTPSGEALRFTSIKGALDSAVENRYRSIRISVQPGTYPEPLQITRSTSIEGTAKGVIISGPINNSDGYSLTLSNLIMRGASPYGLIQRGGALNLSNFGIYGTWRTRADSHSGIALDIAGGVVGRFTSVTLNENQGLALLMQGAGTKVLALRLLVQNNRINRLILESSPSDRWTERISAVEVADGALLLGDNPIVENNEFYGVMARGGGKVHFRAGRITGTRSVDFESRRWGGINISSRTRSMIELRNMQVSDAQLAGIQNAGSWFKASDSKVVRNAIGVHIKDRVEPSYDPFACLAGSGTIYSENGRNFDAELLPVPGTGLGDRTPPDCPGVPWEF